MSSSTDLLLGAEFYRITYEPGDEGERAVIYVANCADPQYTIADVLQYAKDWLRNEDEGVIIVGIEEMEPPGFVIAAYPSFGPGADAAESPTAH